MNRPPKPTIAEKKRDDEEKPFSTRDLKFDARRIQPCSEWRDRLGAAQKMSAVELCDVVYAMAREGAPLGVIAAYYGLEHRELAKIAGDAWNMANAELVIEIFRDQIMTALHSKQVLAKIYVGKQFAGQRDAEPLSADLSQTSDVGGLTINVNVAKANRDDSGKTADPDREGKQEAGGVEATATNSDAGSNPQSTEGKNGSSVVANT